jgi:putative YhdH/YhfP family quinone oxidoreductase
VRFLSQLGYRVAAATGKSDRRDWLLSQGASRVIDRSEVNDESGKPLLKGQWAGAVDTIGGNTLATILRGTDRFGCVAACGLAGGSDLPMTVFPFILRGVTLAGIDSAWCPMPRRMEIWNLLAANWKPADLKSLASKTSLDGLNPIIQSMLQGGHLGRTIVEL